MTPEQQFAVEVLKLAAAMLAGVLGTLAKQAHSRRRESSSSYEEERSGLMVRLERAENEVQRQRDWKHDEVAQWMSEVNMRLGAIEQVLGIQYTNSPRGRGGD